jgi:biotin transport system substrate-specific component
MESFGNQAAISGNSIRIRMLTAFFFTAVTVACAQVSFRLWFTPVPVTLQVFAALLAGLALGSRWGAISQLQYLMLGAMGLPVFAEFKAGAMAFAGPTAGYLLGFAAGAFAAGWVFERLGGRSFFAALAGGVAGIAAIHFFGFLWVATWLSFTAGKPLAACLTSAWLIGTAPFIGVDVLKAIVASGLVLGGRTLHKP